MITIASKHSLRTYNSQIPSILHLNLATHHKPTSHHHQAHSLSLTHHFHQSISYHLNTNPHINPLHHVSHHHFSWSSESNRRATAPKPIHTPLPNLEGAESEYPGEWDETGTSKKKLPSDPSEKREGQTYLEDEYFGDKSPIHAMHGLITPKLPDLDKKEPLTPLAEEIKQIIHARGPMTFSTFWQLCMQHPKYGYYMTKDPIGKEGDFITTPEMFSGFSECLAVWCAFTWESMGRPQKIKIIEYGPGMGSVAKTMMDVIRKAPLKPFKDAISFHLIESSSRLRWKQKTKLGLGNVRKFKTRVKKPVYSVTNVAPYAERTPKDLQQKQKKKELEKPKMVSSEEYHKEPETKSNLLGLDTDPVEVPKKSKGVTPINTDPEIRIDPKKRIRPIVSRHQPLSQQGQEPPEFKTRDDIPAELLEPAPKRERKPTSNILEPGQDSLPKMTQNPFMADSVFGEMPQRALGAVGMDGNLDLNENIKQKYKPFDWSQHNPEVFGHVDDEMKPYVTGSKSREWEQTQSQIKVAEDPLASKSKSKSTPKKPENAQQTVIQRPIEDTSMSTSGAMFETGDSKIINSSTDEPIQVYDQPLSPHGAATTIPQRKTKRDIESEHATKQRLGFDQEAFNESIQPEQPQNPFQSIMDKIEQQEIKGGTAAGIDFSDLLDHEDLRSDMTEEEEEIWQARTKDGILVSWHNSLHSVEGGPALFLCHEFFDALPISHFEFRPHGWVETVVDVDDDEDTLTHFKLVRGPVATFASTVLDRQFAAKGIKPSIGQQFSICSEGNEIANHIGRWIGQYGGAGFIIDYGGEQLPAWTVQGIKQHKPENPMSKPGEVDISAHVQFNALKAAIQSNKGVKAFGPVTQSYFLQGCGIIERFRQYMKESFDSREDKDDEKVKKEKQEFFETFAKIMDVDKLGGHFKVLGFGKENYGVPIGFRTPISEKQAKTDEMGLPVYN